MTALHPIKSLLATLMLSSCSMQYYMPNQHNVPLLRERGEVRFVAAKANAGMVSGPQHLPRAIASTLINRVPAHELQAAWAMSKHLGIMANAAWFKTEGTSSSQRGRLLEIAPGYYHAFGRHGVVEGYAGIGVLRSEHNYGMGARANARFIRPFLQPIIGYASRNFDAALSTRIVWLHCNSRTLAGERAINEIPEQIELGGTRTLIEPSFIMRFGGRAFKLQVQFGGSFCHGRNFRRVDKTFGVGFQFNINNSFRSKAQA